MGMPLFTIIVWIKKKVMKKLFMILLLAICTLHTYSQYVLNKDAIITFINLPKKIENTKRASVSIERFNTLKTSPTLIGSGFIVQKNQSIYAITNYHVFKKVDEQKNLRIGFNADNKKQYAYVKHIYLDSINDIAVFEVGSIYSYRAVKADTTLKDIANYIVDKFQLAKDIQEGTGVILIGYPLGLGAKYTGNKPVSRIGIVAQEPNLKTNTFLLDCLANHGNSGSPVINANDLRLMGMVTSFKIDIIDYPITDTLNKIDYQYNSGLTVCVTSDVILKLIP